MVLLSPTTYLGAKEVESEIDACDARISLPFTLSLAFEAEYSTLVSGVYSLLSPNYVV